MTTLTITFEDTPEGFKFYPSEDLKLAADRVSNGSPDVTTAEIMAAVSFVAVLQTVREVAAEMNDAGYEARLTRGDGADVTTSVVDGNKTIN